MCQQVGDTTCIGVLGEGFAHLAHACPDVGSRVGVEECEIGEAYIAQTKLIAQAACRCLVVAYLFGSIHLRVVPTRKSAVFGEIVLEDRRDR